MKTMTKLLTGVGAAFALTVTAVAPAEAQRYRYRDRDRIDVGEIVAGVALLGGVAALISALDNDNDRYRYDRYGYGYGGYGQYGYGSARAAVNACGSLAQRYGRNVQITDLDRDRGYFRVRGRLDSVDYDYGRWNRRYDYDRDDFTCYARGGQVYDFRV